PNLGLDAVRSLQRGDTECEMEKGDLRLKGVEVLVARNWVKEEFWPRIQDAVQAGYAAEKTYTFMRAHGDRRRTRRPKKWSRPAPGRRTRGCAPAPSPDRRHGRPQPEESMRCPHEPERGRHRR